MEAAREAVRNDLNTRQLGREPDAITTAVVSLEYDREGRPERYNVWLPVGQQPLGARGDGLDNAIRVLQHNVRARLEAMDVRESGIAVKGVREIKLFMNAGPRLLARGIEGAAWVTLPSALEAKKACVNIHNEDKRCLIYCLCAFMLDQQGNFPRSPRSRKQLPGR
ncbi:MAG UNVERIFIED_CONTAM: hypothetical protein LVR29_07530 [Microcystis novacekii LVE1205-3]|jgi:hypothetical protein